MVIEKSGNTVNKSNKAQAMVEFAIVIPIVMVLVLAIFDFGRLIFAYTSISAASREAARYGSGVGSSGSAPLYNDCDGIKAAALRIGRFAGVKAVDITISQDDGPGTTSTPYCTVSKPTAEFTKNDRIRVNVDVRFDPIVPLVNIPSFWLHSQNAHTILMGAQVDAAWNTIDTGGQTCDTSKFSFVQAESAGMYTITIRNNSTKDYKINQLAVLWTPSNKQCTTNCLVQITDPSNNTTVLNNAIGIYLAPVDWNFSINTDYTFKLKFTNTLSVIDEPDISLYLNTEKTCGFGTFSTQ